MKRKLKRIFLFLLYLSAVLLLLLCVLELSYRKYWFDFYAAEDLYLNENINHGDGSRIVFFGDSYTAGGQYISFLRKDSPGKEIINAGIPGTSIREAALIAKNRIGKYRPEDIVIQVYPGNDFTDLHPLTGAGIPALKVLYLRLSESFRSLAWLNYKMGQFRSKPSHNPKTDSGFNALTYNPRQKELFRADPGYLHDILELKGHQTSVVQEWWAYFDELQSETDADTRIWILVIPHCAQVSREYADRMEQLGGLRPEDHPDPSQTPLYRCFLDSCKVRNILWIDPLPAFRKADSMGCKVYLENDFHLSPEGDSVLARFLKQTLQP